MDIKGKKAIVTGGTDGIGLWIARKLKERGAAVIVCGRRADRIEAARAEKEAAELRWLELAEQVEG